MSQEIPIVSEWGYWLPVYEDTVAAHRLIRKTVLWQFRAFVRRQRGEWNLGKVKNFKWMVKAGNNTPIEPIPESYPTYGWKCTFIKTKATW